jgi:O-antigen/teichoic acid export membrane protein
MPASARRILANTTYRLSADVGAKIASVALFVVMARELGEAGFGLFSFALALVMLVTAAADFGQDRVLTREVARRPATLDGYLANTLALKLALALPGLAVATAIVAATGADRTTLAVVALLGLAVIADLLTATCFAVYQAFERMAFIPVVLVTQRFVTAVVGIAALLLGAGVVPVAAIFLLSAVLGFGLALTLLLGRVARPRLELRPRMWSALMRAAAPIGLAGLFAIVLFRIDMVMLAAFEPHQVVGQYGAAYRLFETTLFLSWAVGAAVYPVLSRSSRTSDPPVAGVYERSIKLVVALTLPLAAGAAILADPLVRLVFGAQYDEAGEALALLAPAIAFYPLAYVAGYLLVSQDRSGWLTVTYAVVAVENVALNFVLIPWFSLEGAALGTSISEFLAAAILLLGAARTVGARPRVRVLAGPALASALAAVAMALLADELLLAIAAGGVAYVAALVAFESAVYPQDARMVWASLRPASR